MGTGVSYPAASGNAPVGSLRALVRVAMLMMSAMTMMHEQMHQRTSEEDQIGKKGRNVHPMLDDKQGSGNQRRCVNTCNQPRAISSHAGSSVDGGQPMRSWLSALDLRQRGRNRLHYGYSRNPAQEMQHEHGGCMFRRQICPLLVNGANDENAVKRGCDLLF